MLHVGRDGLGRVVLVHRRRAAARRAAALGELALLEEQPVRGGAVAAGRGAAQLLDDAVVDPEQHLLAHDRLGHLRALRERGEREPLRVLEVHHERRVQRRDRVPRATARRGDERVGGVGERRERDGERGE